jgi:hypothetical protein
LTFTVKSLNEILKESTNLKLEAQVENLNEVVVTSKKKYKIKTLGSETESSSVSMGFSSNLGGELGRRINIRKNQTQILEFKTHAALNTYKSIKLRLNFYEVKIRLPGKKITTDNIYVDFSAKSGTLKVDLRKYKIFVDNNFYVTLVWVDNYGDGQFSISSGLGTSGIKEKFASEDT